jgi:Tfp pilus assembly protein PilX
MQRIKSTLPKSGSSRRSKQERGIALITTLLLLMLLSGLALAMAWSTRSDMLIGGYYRNSRGSFYAADSGLNIVRQAMTNQFTPLPTGILIDPTKNPPGTPPVSNAAIANLVQGLQNTYSGYTSLTGAGTGSAVNSWPEKFALAPGANNPSLVETACTWNTTVAPPVGQPKSGTCMGANPVLPTVSANFVYTYKYTITVQGQSKGNENTILTDSGIISIESDSNLQNGNKKFSAYGMFIDQQPLCSGTLVPGTITGPVFTNGSWNFGTSGKYTFTDNVEQVNDQAGYGSPCAGVAGNAGGGVAPTFQNGFTRDATAIALPTNSYNQEQAVVDGKGVSAAPPSNTTLASTMRDVNTNPYPSGGTNSGVFLPYTSTKVGGKTVNVFTGGGILVQGNASVTLSTTGNSAQVYQITQGGTTTTISIDPVANTTTISAGGAPTVITGVPQMLDPSTGADLGYDTMLYVNGNITGLSGPANQTSPAIQNGTALTITAASGVTITGNITYTTEPVGTVGSNVDALLSGGDTGQALGIFTAGGNIDMHAPTSNGNLEIDASLATISQGGSGGLVNTGNAINQLTIVGGRIQNTIQNINTTKRNVLFDQRYATGFSPPWFPSTGIGAGNVNAAPYKNLKVSRLSWQNQTAY